MLLLWGHEATLFEASGAARFSAYFFLEILPDLQHSRAARQAVRDIGAVIDPERDLREMVKRLAEADTVENRAALADECLRRGRAADAERLFQNCLTGIHATDHALMLGLARAQFALDDYAGACATLDRLRAAHPDLDCPDGHLLYARSKEQQGEIEQALIEYAALAEYYPGEEARCRLALLLQKKPAASPRPKICSSRWSDRSSRRASSITASGGTGMRSRAAT